MADGAVEVAAPTLEEAVRDAEVVLLAAPPLACLDLTDRLGGPLRDALPEDCTVTDVASAKSRIVDRADELKLPFIGGHPMAGRELSGYEAALPDLFVQRAWVTVLGRYARLGDGERIGELIETCGSSVSSAASRAKAIEPRGAQAIEHEAVGRAPGEEARHQRVQRQQLGCR